jgi:molybdenum cofactor biosynthesis enzyme MoaA
MSGVAPFLEKKYGRYWDCSKFPDGVYSTPLSNEMSGMIRNNVTSVVLAVTPRCNSRCKLCISGKTKMDEFSVEDVGHVMKMIGRDKHVVLYGGEPTLHEELFGLLDTVRKSGNTPSICTNGLKLADYDFTKTLSGYLRNLSFSFDGFGKNIYYKLRGDSNQYNLKLEALENLEKLGLKVNIISTVVRDLNMEQLPEILNFIITRKSFIKSWMIIPATGNDKSSAVSEEVTILDILNVLEGSTGGVINLDYFVESRRFYSRINDIASKLGILIPKGGPIFYAFFTLDKRGLDRMFDMHSLKKFNSSGLFGSFNSGLSIIRKRPWLLRKLLRFKSPYEKIWDLFLHENLFSIRLHEMNRPDAFKNFEHHAVMIRKKEGGFWVDQSPCVKDK